MLSELELGPKALFGPCGFLFSLFCFFSFFFLINWAGLRLLLSNHSLGRLRLGWGGVGFFVIRFCDVRFISSTFLLSLYSPSTLTIIVFSSFSSPSISTITLIYYLNLRLKPESHVYVIRLAFHCIYNRYMFVHMCTTLC